MGLLGVGILARVSRTHRDAGEVQPGQQLADGSLMHVHFDKALASAGASRQVVVAFSYFFDALAAVARTDLLVTVPRRIAHCHAAQFGLAAALPPVTIRSFPVQMVWSNRLGVDSALNWLRDRIQETSQRVE